VTLPKSSLLIFHHHFSMGMSGAAMELRQVMVTAMLVMGVMGLAW
jgi:hypothetical protein